MQIQTVEKLFNDPMLYLADIPAEEFNALSWYINLISKQYQNKGYFINSKSWEDLTFPSGELFNHNISSDQDPDLTKLYHFFSWQCFLKYCQPMVTGNHLDGFAYKGIIPLTAGMTKYMLRFPSVDWINATLLKSSIDMDDSLREIITKNRIGYARDIHCAFKQLQSRLYAALYLLDHLPFIIHTYDEDFSNIITCCTRSPEFIRALVPSQADALITQLDNDVDFDTPISGIIKVVQLTATQSSALGLDYQAEIIDLDMQSPFTQFIPFVAFRAYVDGFSSRINDMPDKAALLELDLQKTGSSQRYCTLNQQVFRAVFQDIDKLRVNSRARFHCGLDIADFSFKYWNLQSSITTERSYSAFSPFSLRGIRTFDMSKLSHDVLDANYQSIKLVFQNRIKTCTTVEAKQLAAICGIDPSRPMLNLLLDEFVESKHPTELYKLIQANKRFFEVE